MHPAASLFLLTACLISGCVTKVHPVALYPDRVKDFKTGVTTRADMVAALGRPSYARSSTLSAVRLSWKMSQLLELPRESPLQPLFDRERGLVHFVVFKQVAGLPLAESILPDLIQQWGPPARRKLERIPVRMLTWVYDETRQDGLLVQHSRGKYTAVFDPQGILRGSSVESESTTTIRRLHPAAAR